MPVYRLLHMTIVPLGSARLVAFFRRRQADFVQRSESLDGGDLVGSGTDGCPNNNSSIAAMRLLDGRIALVCDPVNAAMDPSRRASFYDELGVDDRPEADGGCSPVWASRAAR